MPFNPEEALKGYKETQEYDVGFDPEKALEKYHNPESEDDIIQDTLENEFDPEKTASPGLRWSLARADNFEEMQARVKKKYPEGEVKYFPKSTMLGTENEVLMFRESPEAQWGRVDPQGFDPMDVPEALAGSAEAIAGEAIAAYNTKGASIFWLIMRQAFGATVGEIVEQTEQSIFDTQRQGPGEIVTEVGTEGAFSAGGGFLARPFVGAYNALRGAGALRIGDTGIDTLKAMEELDPRLVKKATPGLVTDNPAIRTTEKQASALLPGMRRRYDQLIGYLDKAVRTASPGNSANAMKSTVESLSDFNSHFLHRLRVTGTKASEGGQAVIEGIEEYSRLSQDIVSSLYERAAKIEEPIFNLKPALDVAGDIAGGSAGKPDQAVLDALQDLANISGPKTLPSGRVLSVTDQIRNVRGALWELSQPEPGYGMRQTNHQAKEVYNAVTGVLNDPQNTDALFRKAWKSANNAAADRFTTLGKAPIYAAAKSENPISLVKTYLAPDQAPYLLAIRETISPEKWNQFVDAGYSQLLREPEKITDVLKSFDQETLDVWMPRQVQEEFLKIGKEAKRIFSVGAEELSERQVTNRNFVDSLINSADPRDAQTIIRAYNNTNNQAARQSLRAAIVEWAWDGVVVAEKAGTKVDNKLLKSRVTQLKDSGMWRILSSEERRIIGNAEVVSRAFQSVQDAGTALIAASAVTDLPSKAAITTFIRYGMLGSLYTSPFGRRLLIGGGLPNNQGKTLSLLGASMARMAPTVDIESLLEEDEN